MDLRPDPRTLDAVVAHYRLTALGRTLDDAWWKAEGEPWPVACRRAASAMRATGTIHGHQNRPGAEICARFGEVVSEISEDLAGMKEFDRLLVRIEEAGAGVWGAGELVCYDTADRLALRLNLEPLVVYLHAGTRVGASQLVAGIRKSTRSITVTALPGALAELTPREAEDVLCVYAGRFHDTPEEFDAWAGGRSGRCSPRQRRRRSC